MTVVLVAEDVAAISLALEDALADAGYIAVAFSANRTALEWLKERTPDLAMLDLVLSDGSTVGLAHVLRKRGVPTMFLSGYRRSLPSDLDDLMWVEKPVSYDQLIGSLRDLGKQRVELR